MRELTLIKAAAELKIPKEEVKRRIASGALKARKKTESKFSDWIIQFPDTAEDKALIVDVNKTLDAEKGKWADKTDEELADKVAEALEMANTVVDEPIQQTPIIVQIPVAKILKEEVKVEENIPVSELKVEENTLVSELKVEENVPAPEPVKENIPKFKSFIRPQKHKQDEEVYGLHQIITKKEIKNDAGKTAEPKWWF